MITILNSLPENVVGFRAIGRVTFDDFSQVVLPKVKAFLEEHDELNYILVLETEPSNFTAGAWLQDAWLGLRDLQKWNRAAIVTDHHIVEKVTPIFSKIMIGEFRTFGFEDYNEAVKWTSGC